MFVSKGVPSEEIIEEIGGVVVLFCGWKSDWILLGRLERYIEEAEAQKRKEAGRKKLSLE